jgi:general secretion pathway protein H
MKPRPQPHLRLSRWQRGFTLIEILVVLAIVALGTGALVWALRDSASQQLDEEAQRLSALLEAGRAQSRTSGVALRWRSSDTGFVIETLPSGLAPVQTHAWLYPQTRASVSTLWLGPEPILPPQSLVLTQGDGSRGSVRVASDGLRAFGTSP